MITLKYPFVQTEGTGCYQEEGGEKEEKARIPTNRPPLQMDLEQGPNSPHIHMGFPEVAGKYIYCPSKVYSLYRDKGMAKEMAWKNLRSLSSMKQRDINGWKKKGNEEETVDTVHEKILS